MRLRDYVDRRCDELQAQMNRRISDDQHVQEVRADEQRRNIELAAGRIDDRLQGMNEFREQLREQATTLASRTEVDTLRESVTRRLEELTLRVDRMETAKASTDAALAARARRAQQVYGAYLGAATLLISVVIFLANYLTGGH